jgi:hypothetical protein
MSDVLADCMAASTVWWEGHLREMRETSEDIHSRDAYVRFLIAVAATVFVLCFNK